MPITIDHDLRFAILIDADNVSEKYIHIVLDEVANSGVATYKRIYGDWTSSRLASWKSCLLDNSITPMQQYSYTYGKNATDSAMIIDAMDILYSGNVDGFAIVSSDSDFTRLVVRLRESGMQVIGMGEQKTPKPFISACNQFKYLDLLYKAQKQSEAEEDAADAAEEAAEAERAPKRRRRRGGAGGHRTQNAVQETVAGEEALGGETAAADGIVPLDTGHADPAVESGLACSDELAVQFGEDAEAGCPSHRARRRPGDRGIIEPSGEDRYSEADADRIDSSEDEYDEDDTDLEFGEMSRSEKRRHLRAIRQAIGAIVDTFSDDDGWVSLGQLGDQLGKRLPDFDVRNYGYKRLHPFLKSLGVYEFEEPSGESGRRQIYLRVK